MPAPKLASLDLPDFGEPTAEPEFTRDFFRGRISRLQTRMSAEGHDAIVIFADREHCANLVWATGVDPRFEEAILVVIPGRKPALILGNECFPYAETANGDFERLLWQHLSLMGQPRGASPALAEILAEAGLEPGMRIGVAGWKGHEDDNGDFDPDWLETPHYLVEALKRFGTVTNAALMFMHPENGLRVINEVDQLAAFEVSATRTSLAVLRVIRGMKAGLTEYEALRALRFEGPPLSVHVNFSAGPRARYGLPSPSFRVIEKGDPIVLGVGMMGALNCRAGFVARDENDLPDGIRDYVDRLVSPYFGAIAAWYETVGIGVEGGALHAAVMSRIGDPFFGITLNPGHLIHLDEWVHSPVRRGSKQRLASGMAIQCDVIPATGTPWFTTNIEDGIALADEAMRADFAERFPEGWARIEKRRAFMRDVIGIDLRPEVLPFSSMPAWLPPFWLDSSKAMAMR
ncbi:MAG: aminopeptidase P family N-terminal domain-containing protein [Phyllobacteriaceae bacterium]|nr:aminopeptidase P family N-terminal domain-containing protein [Phyllobacteriaceae bacterium]